MAAPLNWPPGKSFILLLGMSVSTVPESRIPDFTIVPQSEVSQHGEGSTTAHFYWKEDSLLPPLLTPCFPPSPCTDSLNLAVSWFSLLTEQETPAKEWIDFCWVSELNQLTEKSDECQNQQRTGLEPCSWTSAFWLQQWLSMYTVYPCS